MSYVKEVVPIIMKRYKMEDVRTWPYYPIVVPLKEGRGPASDAECDEITYEVWDHFCNSYGSFQYMPDAINEAMRLTKELIE